MIRDAQTALWEAAALTSTAVSDNYIDLGAAYVTGGILNEIGAGEPIGLNLAVGVAADHTTGNETYQFDIITATAVDLTTGQKVLVSRVIDYTDLTAGRIHFIEIPPGTVDQRYLGAKYTGGGTSPTITVTAWIGPRAMNAVNMKYYKTAQVVL